MITSINTIEDFVKSPVWQQISADIKAEIERGKSFIVFGFDEDEKPLTEQKTWEIRGSIKRMLEFLRIPEIYKEELLDKNEPNEEVKNA